MMQFEIVPYVSVGSLRWGMSSAEVSAIVGPASRTSRNRYKNIVEFREGFSQTCIYDHVTERLVEVTFSELKGTLFFGSLDLIESSNLVVIRSLLRGDASAVAGHDAIVFPNLGIALTGYRPNNEAIKAAGAFAKGRWDIPGLDMQPLDVP